MLRGLSLFAAVAAAAATSTPSALTLAVSSTSPSPLFTVWPSYLSVNVDTASLTNSLDFDDPVFVALAAQLRNASAGRPLQFRIGGGTADAACFTGAGGPAGNCTGSTLSPPIPSCSTCINDAYLASIARFQAATDVSLVFDFNAVLRSNATAPWDPSNAELLLARMASTGMPFGALQLGNEPELWVRRNLTVTGTQLGQDLRTLAGLVAASGLPNAAAIPFLGPSACCDHSSDFLLDYIAAAGDALAALDFHTYPIGRLGTNKSCDLPAYPNVTAWREGLDPALALYASIRDKSAQPALPLVLGETATSADGGCADYSNRFVAGGEFIYTLARAGEMGVSQVNRQDLVGFSGPTEPSQYALAGPAGWSSGSAALAGNVHPDYFTALLWRQLVGERVLASALHSSPAVTQADAHVWCGAEPDGTGVLSFTNYADAPATLALVDSGSGAALPTLPRTEYVLSSVPTPGTLPVNLTGDALYLNGLLLGVDAGGRVLPSLPLPGAAGAAQTITLPPWTYGYMVLPGPFAACTGTAAAAEAAAAAAGERGPRPAAAAGTSLLTKTKTSSRSGTSAVPPSFTASLGPEVVLPYPSPHPYQFPDSAFALLPDQDGTGRILFWTDGNGYRVTDSCNTSSIVPLCTPSPLTPVVRPTTSNSSAYDANGNWVLAAFRPFGNATLAAFSHVENHNFPCGGSYGEWNGGAVLRSDDDGVTWAKTGLAVGDPQPCSGAFGGTGYSSILSHPDGGYIAWGGCSAFRSLDPLGSPGTWRRNGGPGGPTSFGEPGFNGSSTCLPGLSPNICCPIVHFNTYLNAYVAVWTQWGVNNTLFMAASEDGLTWGPSSVLLTTEGERAVGYGQVFGHASSSTAGATATLAYAAAPPTSGYPRDFVVRSIVFVEGEGEEGEGEGVQVRVGGRK
jgi:hypothetical protein